jgi:hypothetical protein
MYIGILDMNNEIPDQNDFEWWQPIRYALDNEHRHEEEDHHDDDSVKIDKHCLFGHEVY